MFIYGICLQASLGWAQTCFLLLITLGSKERTSQTPKRLTRRRPRRGIRAAVHSLPEGVHFPNSQFTQERPQGQLWSRAAPWDAAGRMLTEATPVDKSEWALLVVKLCLSVPCRTTSPYYLCLHLELSYCPLRFYQCAMTMCVFFIRGFLVLIQGFSPPFYR